MKKVIAILLSAMMIISSAALAVNAEEIKDVFGVNEQSKAVESLSDVGSADESRGDGEYFNLQKVEYSSTYADLGNEAYDGYDNNVTTYGTGNVNKNSQNPNDYNLTTRFTIKASASATTGELIIPLDNIYDVSNSLSGSSAPYFKNFTYKVGDGTTQSATVMSGPVYGIEGTNKYLSLPLVSIDTAETNLNVYLYCNFELEHASLVKRNAVFFDKYYTAYNNAQDDTLEGVLLSSHLGYVSNAYIDASQINRGNIFRGLETQEIMNHHTSYEIVSDLSKHLQIPLVDMEHPVVSTITISPGVQVEFNEEDIDLIEIKGDINTGYTITSYVTQPGNISNRDASTRNYTLRSYNITVPESSNISQVIIKEEILAHTKDGDEITEKTRTIDVIDPIQDLYDGAFKMSNNQIFYDLDTPVDFKQDNISKVSNLANEGLLPIFKINFFSFFIFIEICLI